jgi:hypothetical protein
VNARKKWLENLEPKDYFALQLERKLRSDLKMKSKASPPKDPNMPKRPLNAYFKFKDKFEKCTPNDQISLAGMPLPASPGERWKFLVNLWKQDIFKSKDSVFMCRY